MVHTYKGPVRAPFSLAQGMAGAKHKKLFNPYGMRCGFCSKNGHTVSACASRPTTPLPAFRSEWADCLLASPQVDVMQFRGMSVTAAQEAVQTLGRRLNTGNPWSGSTHPRDALRGQLGFWKAIGANSTVLSWLAYGVPLRLVAEPPHYAFCNHASYFEHKSFVDTEIAECLSSQYFLSVPRDFPAVLNPLQVEPKGVDKHRMCTDLRWVNARLPRHTFKMSTLYNSMPSVVRRGHKLFTADLKKAYYSLFMEERAWPYMCFEHQGECVCGCVLLFGLSTAPMYFTKVCKPIIAFLHVLLILVMYYLDDWLFSEEPSKAEALSLFVRWLIETLGFRFSDKCQWTPSSVVSFTGMLLDAEQHVVRAPPEKIARLQRLITLMKARADSGLAVSVHDIRSLTGTALSLSLAVAPVRVWTRGLYAADKEANRLDADTVVLGSAARDDLAMLGHVLHAYNGAPIRDPAASACIQVDTGGMGVGVACGAKLASLPLPTCYIGLSSTLRELVGLRMALSECAADLTGKHVLVQMDSSASIRNLLKGGGPVPELCEQVRAIWRLCETSHIRPVFEWVPREQLSHVDALSKLLDRAWQLRPRVLAWLASVLPGPLTASWSDDPRHILFLLPNFNAVSQAVTQARIRQKRVCIVYPCWPNQPWWPQVEALASHRFELPRACDAFEPSWLESPIGTGPPEWRVFAAVLDFR